MNRLPRPPAWLAAAVASGLILVAALIGSWGTFEPTGPLPVATMIRPVSDDEVIEVLPRRLGASLRELAGQRARLAREPPNLPLALSLAGQHLQQARQSGDPRELGYAQSALNHWWSMKQPPNEVLLLRATILQSRHEFDAALRDLEGLVARAPDNVRAWLLHASVAQVLGRFDEARASCHEVVVRSDHLAGHVCLAELRGLSGDASAYAELLDLLDARRDDPAVRGWIETVLAEMAIRLDLPEAAERHLHRAIASGDELYPRLVLADLMLERGRAAQADRLLLDSGASDAVLLRRAIALKRLDAPGAQALAGELRARFETAGQGPERRHLREQARFALEVVDQPDQALALALANWEAQKESVDARLVAAAARAASRPEAARPVRLFAEQVGLLDRPLARLLAERE